MRQDLQEVQEEAAEADTVLVIKLVVHPLQVKDLLEDLELEADILEWQEAVVAQEELELMLQEIQALEELEHLLTLLGD